MSNKGLIDTAVCAAAFDEWYAAQRHQLSNEQVCRLIWTRGWEASSKSAESRIDQLLAAIAEHVTVRSEYFRKLEIAPEAMRQHGAPFLNHEDQWAEALDQLGDKCAG